MSCDDTRLTSVFDHSTNSLTAFPHSTNSLTALPHKPVEVKPFTLNTPSISSLNC